MSPWRVTSVLALWSSQLDVTFVDGTTGKVDMRNFLSGPAVDGTVFESLREPDGICGSTSRHGRSSVAQWCRPLTRRDVRRNL